MMWNGAGAGDGWLWLLVLLLVVLGGVFAGVAVEARQRKAFGGEGHATWILRERLARGEIDEAEYRDRLAVLGAASGRDPRRRSSQALPILAAVGAAALFVAAVGAAAVASRPSGARIVWGPRVAQGTACTFPTLQGQTVDVALTDMGGMMQGGMMQGGMMQNGMMQGGMMGVMRVVVRPSTISAGVVSFRVRNVGGLVHELVVLPLPPGGVGSRPIGADGAVSEAGDFGEASRTCGAGTGDGISPGGIGWVTLQLGSGRYELVCNLPGHYASGMFTELDVR